MVSTNFIIFVFVKPSTPGIVFIWGEIKRKIAAHVLELFIEEKNVFPKFCYYFLFSYIKAMQI